MKTLAQRIIIESRDEYYSDTHHVKNVQLGCAVYDTLCLACAELDIDLDEVSSKDFDECVDMLANHISDQVGDPNLGDTVYIRFGTEFTDEELVEKLGPYVIVTENHTWGRGHTAYEAAINARISSEWTYCQLYKANPYIEGLINVGEIDGGIEYRFSEHGKRTGYTEDLAAVLRETIKVARGKMKTIRKEKVLVIKYQEVKS